MYKPVSVAKNAFVFCRYSIAILLWTSLIFNIKVIVPIVATLFLLSVIFKVKNSPMIFLYTFTFEKVFPSTKVMLDEKAIRFVHAIALVFSLITIFALYLGGDIIGKVVLLTFAVLKTVTAFGYCPANKLYNCLVLKKGCCVRKPQSSCGCTSC